MCTAQIRSWCNGHAKEMDVKGLEQWIVEELSVPDPDLNNIGLSIRKESLVREQVKVMKQKMTSGTL